LCRSKHDNGFGSIQTTNLTGENNKELRDTVAELESQLRTLASINVSLELELTTQRSMQNSQNMTELRGKKR